MKFSEKLQKLRKEKNLSQEQLANLLEVSRQSVSKWESGLTYPEMDKLLALCKIFGCTLDELTNDEITEIQDEKQKSQLNTIIDEILSFVGRTYSMFKKMNGKEIGRCLVEIGLLIAVLFFLGFPIQMLNNSIQGILYDFNLWTVNAIIDILFNLLHFVIGAIVFLYIFETRYLKEWDEIEVTKTVEVVNEDGETVIEERVEPLTEVRIYKEHKGLNKFVTVLGTIGLFLVKFCVFLCTSPFLLMIVGVAALIAIGLFLGINGIWLVGAIITAISSAIVCYVIIELAVCFIFHKPYAWKRLFIMFMTSLIAGGAGIGVAVAEFSQYSVVFETSPQIELKTDTYKYPMSDELTIMSNYLYQSDSISYQVDESLKDEVVVEVKYNPETLKIKLINQSQNVIPEITSHSENIQFKYIIADLKASKTVYAYDDYYTLGLVVKANKANIEKLEKNYQTAMEKIQQQQQEQVDSSIRDAYEELQVQNQELRDLIDEYQYQIEEYQMQAEEYKYKLEELRNVINSADE